MSIQQVSPNIQDFTKNLADISTKNGFPQYLVGASLSVSDDTLIISTPSQSSYNALLNPRAEKLLKRVAASLYGLHNVSTELIESALEKIPSETDKPISEQSFSHLNIRDKRKSKRFYIDSRFIREGYAAKVGPYGLAVYAILAAFADNDTQECWPSFETIANYATMSRRQVINKVKELSTLNIICVENRKEGKTFTSNIITLLDDEVWVKLKKEK